MAQLVEVNGNTIEFPDGMAAGDIEKAIKANYLSIRPAQATNNSGPSAIDKLLTGISDPVHGGAQLLTNALPTGVVQAGNRLNNWLADKTGLVARLPAGGVDQQVRNREAAYQAERTAAGDTGFDWWRTAGSMASPANLALPAGPAGLSLGAKMLTSAGIGGAGAALAPVGSGDDFWSEKAKQVGTGAAFAGMAPAVANGVSRLISPRASTNPNVNLLKNEGVQPTIGQTLGGWAGALEEKAQSIPFVGDAIAAARGRARDQFNQAAINRTTAPINQQVDGIGSDGVRRAGDIISDAYNAAKNQLGGFRIDQQAGTELAQLRALATSGLEGRERNTFNRYFQDYIASNPGFTAEKFKEFDSKIGSDIARFGQGDAYQQKLADALKEAQRIITENAMRANPQAAQALSAADRAYANLVRVEGASTAAKGADGVFAPGQLLTAVKGADRSVRDRATARGTALMQDLASAGNTVLGNKVPDSGTAGRLLTGAAGAAAMANPLLVGGGTLAGIGLYTPAAQSALRFLVSARPQSAQPVADALRETIPGLLAPAAQIGVGLLR